MRPTIIGLCGRAGSGKSSVARHLREKYGARSISFAEPLKRMAMDIWGFSDQQVFGEADVKEAPDKHTGITPRWAMQKLGQAARNHLGSNVWIIHALNRIEAPGIYVIEDVRYKNEAAALAKLGFVLRLHCSDSISADKGAHPSEYEVDLIPTEHVCAELRGSREQGLDHLFGLVDEVLDSHGLVRR